MTSVGMGCKGIAGREDQGPSTPPECPPPFCGGKNLTRLVSSSGGTRKLAPGKCVLLPRRPMIFHACSRSAVYRVGRANSVRSLPAWDLATAPGCRQAGEPGDCHACLRYLHLKQMQVRSDGGGRAVRFQALPKIAADNKQTLLGNLPLGLGRFTLCTPMYAWQTADSKACFRMH